MDLLIEPQNGYKVFDVSYRTRNYLYPFSTVIRRHGIYYVPDQWHYASVGPIMLFSDPIDTDLFLRVHQDGDLRAYPVKYIPVQPKRIRPLDLTRNHYSTEDIQRFWENSVTEPKIDELSIPPRGIRYAAAICPTYHKSYPDIDTGKIAAIVARFGEDRI